MLWGQTNCSSCLIFCLLDFKLSGHHAKTQYTTTFSSWTKQTWNTSPSRFKPFQLLWINLNPFIQKPQKEKKNGDFMLKPDELEQQTRFYMQRLWMNSPPPPVCQLSLNDLHSSRLLHISKLVYIERPVIMSQISSSYSQLFLLHSHFIIISSCFCRRKQFLNFSLWGV